MKQKDSTNNWLQVPWFTRFLRSKWYPGLFQWAAMLVFAAIVYELVAGTVNPSHNFGTSMTWVLWWPAIPLLFLLLGRFWCAVCPFGKLSDIVRQFSGIQRPMSNFLKKYGIWLIDIFFILITWSDHVFGIVHSPRGSGYLLLLLTTMVVITSVFYERRTFCKTLCFLGGLAGNYSRAGMLELRGTPEVCRTCKSQSCYRGDGVTEGCPMFQYVRTMDTSADCNLCANCVKTCPNDSIRISMRNPGAELWTAIRQAKLEHASLAAVIMGIVFVQNVTMLAIWQDVLDAIASVTRTSNYNVNFTIAFVIAMIIPVGLLWLAAWITASSMGSTRAKELFIRFGYAVIPLDLAGHLAHNLFHGLTEGNSIWMNTWRLFGGNPSGSLALVSDEVVQVLQFSTVGLGLFLSIYAVYRIGNRGSIRSLWSYYLLMIGFAIINIYFFTQPMLHRV